MLRSFELFVLSEGFLFDDPRSKFSVPDLSELVIGYITCPSETIATEIATAAINSRLAACANILPFMISIYEWENNVRSENEGK